MNALTLTQSLHRAQCLSGELKAAQTALDECEAAEAAQARLTTIAGQATQNARGNLERLEAERTELADHMAKLVNQIGVAPIALETEPKPDEEPDTARAEVTFTDGEFGFGHPTQNGLDQTAMNAAFDTARTPQ